MNQRNDDIFARVDQYMNRMVEELLKEQRSDGTWRYCFENGITIDNYIIILFRTLETGDEALIRRLHDRIRAEQNSEGSWKLYHDEKEGNLSASVDAYYALLCSGYSVMNDDHMIKARRFIVSRGGMGKVSSLLTKAVLAATGQARWPLAVSSIPLELLLLPPSSLFSVFDFSGYSRIHLIPMLIMASRSAGARPQAIPDLSHLKTEDRHDDGHWHLSKSYTIMREQLIAGLSKLKDAPQALRKSALKKAEQYMLDRIEGDGTLYSYASSTVLMLFALRALGYEKEHPVMVQAVEGLTAMRWELDEAATIQNSPSTVWDTALLAHALQESGVAASHSSVARAAGYLLGKQHIKKADWSIRNPVALPGGWAFSETNTLYPDVDDTTAALRAIKGLAGTDDHYREASNRGLQWVLSMQNKDGGWPAFEKNTSNEMLTWLAIDEAKSAAIDPSEADLTGRTLEYLGNFAGLSLRQDYVKRGAEWLISHQEKDGSWYGRWGICYIYGTWAALTGLKAIGVSDRHQAIKAGERWLLSVQNDDGGWGESCLSDKAKRYVRLGASTPSQTAWALDALIAVSPHPTAEIMRGMHSLMESLNERNWLSSYPTGAGLPGHFYVHYHSYRKIWPLLALSRFRSKFNK